MLPADNDDDSSVIRPLVRHPRPWFTGHVSSVSLPLNAARPVPKSQTARFRPRRKELGRFFSEAARLLWLEMLRREWSKADLGRALSEISAEFNVSAGLDRTSLVSRWLYGLRRPNLAFVLLLERLFQISPALWNTKPIQPFAPPWAQTEDPTAATPEVAS